MISKEKLYSWHIDSLLRQIDFVTESVTGLERSYIESDSAQVYVKVTGKSNAIYMGNHVVSN